MLKTYLRPMTETEREALSEELLNSNRNPYSWGEAIWCSMGYAVLGFVISLFLVRLLLIWHDDIAWVGILMCAYLVAGFICGFVRSLKYQRHIQKQYAALIAQRLVRGEVEITEVRATDVIEADPEDWDTEPMFLFEIGNRQVLFLYGQHFIETVESEDIDCVPYDAFEIVRYPDAPSEIVQVYPKGNPLPISRTYRWNNYEAMNELIDGEVLDNITLATIEQDCPDLFTDRNQEREM